MGTEPHEALSSFSAFRPSARDQEADCQRENRARDGADEDIAGNDLSRRRWILAVAAGYGLTEASWQRRASSCLEAARPFRVLTVATVREAVRLAATCGFRI